VVDMSELKYFHSLIDRMPEKAYDELRETLESMLDYYTNLNNVVHTAKPIVSSFKATLAPPTESVPFVIEDED